MTSTSDGGAFFVKYVGCFMMQEIVSLRIHCFDARDRESADSLL